MEFFAQQNFSNSGVMDANNQPSSAFEDILGFNSNASMLNAFCDMSGSSESDPINYNPYAYISDECEGESCTNSSATSDQSSETDSSSPPPCENQKPSNAKSIRKRSKFTQKQLDILEQSFNQNQNPNTKTRHQLGKELRLTPRCVQIWFQNRRAKQKSELRKKNTDLNVNPVIDHHISWLNPASKMQLESQYRSLFKPNPMDSMFGFQNHNLNQTYDNLSDYGLFYSIPAFDNHQAEWLQSTQDQQQQHYYSDSTPDKYAGDNSSNPILSSDYPYSTYSEDTTNSDYNLVQPEAETIIY